MRTITASGSSFMFASTLLPPLVVITISLVLLYKTSILDPTNFHLNSNIRAFHRKKTQTFAGIYRPMAKMFGLECNSCWVEVAPAMFVVPDRASSFTVLETIHEEEEEEDHEEDYEGSH